MFVEFIISSESISKERILEYSPLLTNPEELTACERLVQHAARTCLGLVETPPLFLSQASLSTRRCRRPTGNSAVDANTENERTVTAY